MHAQPAAYQHTVHIRLSWLRRQAPMQGHYRLSWEPGFESAAAEVLASGRSLRIIYSVSGKQEGVPRLP